MGNAVAGLEQVLEYPRDIESLASRFADLRGFARVSSHTRTEALDIISALPRQMLRNKGGRWILTSQYSQSSVADIDPTPEEIRIDHPALYLSEWLSGRSDTSSIPFNGGLIGFLTYGARPPKGSQQLEDTASTPLLQVGLYDWAIVCDHGQQSCRLFFGEQCSEQIRQLVLQRVTRDAPTLLPFRLEQRFKPDQPRDTYRENFARIQDYIHAGDCYQINYAQRFSATFEGDPWRAFQHIRRSIQPAYTAFIRTDEGAVLSFSPEQFLTIRGDRVTTAPIKGTRPRGRTPDEDLALKEHLAQSPKDRAENLMIVDLLRNDLALHAQTGSVQVTKLFEIQSFHNVHHMVTTIEARKRPEVSPLLVLWDAFPGGSITGAPKKRAMEIIAELEPHSRSVYCGSIFWCSHSGNLSSNIAIRTLVCEGDQIYCWGGGGIVADSEEEKEYQESINKVAYFMNCLEAEFFDGNDGL